MKTKRKSSIILILCILVICSLCFLGFHGLEVAGIRFKPFNEAITKGLDLQGGVSVVMEIQDDEVTAEDLEKTKSQLELRVNKIGVSETVVATEGDKRIRIDIPGVYDSSEIVDSLSKTGELTFRSPNGDTLLTGQDIEKASVTTDNTTGKPVVSLVMNSEGTTKFADATSKYVGQNISIYMDEEELTSPQVSSAITDGKAVISGDFTISKAKSIAGVINAGALPVTVKAANVKTVGAQLGADALPNAMKAAAVGIGLIFIFMIIYYRGPGVVASFALSLFIVLVLLCMIEIGATLTLPGIAALLLTIGMAVDANVLIFERIKEELKKGVSIKTSVEKGFENALSSIIDSNVTTIIAGLVLYFLGSGSVKGFAVTLLIGIIVSMITALFISKFFMRNAVNAGWLSKPSQFVVKIGQKNDKVIKAVERKKIWFSISILIILIGIVSFAIKGANIGIDFKGGTIIVLEYTDGFDKEATDAKVKSYVSDAVTNTIDDNQYEIKSADLDTETFSKLFEELKADYNIADEVVSQDETGASVGKDLTVGAIKALIIAFIAMLIYIAIRFEYKFGIVAIISLLHDVIVTMSVYFVFGISINSPFIAAILTIVGYSINAAIVIFDRIRENTKLMRRATSDEIINTSVTQTMTRSINTTLTTLFTIIAVHIFVPAVRDFSFPLIIGIISGAYSSVFIAPSLYSLIKNREGKKKTA
ncbi:MAG: protein translocase subunit SecD [Clostridiales bacterium]|nr:protein translocase subunit SecD [Clostridiales bacterium]